MEVERLRWQSDQVEVEWECWQWWAGKMVMIVVVQTVASGERVTLLRALLLA